MSDSAVEKHAGGCHCGAVRFEVEVDLTKGGNHCNCTICVKRNALATILKPSAFRLLSGEGSLGRYQWGMKNATYQFCSTCGIHVFGRGNIPEIGGEYVSVNLNCLDEIDPAKLTVGYWDGRHNNWQSGLRDKPWPVTARQ